MGSDEIQFVEHGSRRFGFVHILDKLAEVYVLNGEPQKATGDADFTSIASVLLYGLLSLLERTC